MTKPKLLLLHGALGSSKQFESIKPLLAEDFEVFDLNFEGHGGVETDQQYSIQLFTENVIAFLSENKIDSIDIFGYSMGGYVALNLALQQPHLAQKIVTLGTKFDWSMEAAMKEVKMLNPAVIAEKVPRFAQKLHEEHQPLDWKKVVEQTAQMMIGMAEGAKLEAGDFSQIQHEVLLLLGSKDNMVSFEESKWVEPLLSNGSLTIAEGFYHPIDKVPAEQLSDYIVAAFQESN